MNTLALAMLLVPACTLTPSPGRASPVRSSSEDGAPVDTAPNPGDTGDGTPDTADGTDSDSAPDTDTHDTSTDTGTTPDELCRPYGLVGGISILLTWSDPVDLDLHLMDQPDTLFQTPHDCNFCSLAPDWGTSGDANDDPELAYDSITSPPGCERILVPAPADGAYYLAVHYFHGDAEPSSPATATVTTWADGVLVSTDALALDENTVWAVAELDWPTGAYTLSTETPATATARTCTE